MTPTNELRFGRMAYPYNLGWPTNPFTKLSPNQMAQLLRDMRVQQREEVGEALI